ncbi:sugar ABC transporter substrate-binding protein [Caballeronia choica]|uniref:Sugar ABC transporter substrate-binding protein n=1 Tax=Caballeronia choica TaxID=326476 RepID=A0A158G4C9_9BURK|nr:substrate-binding domain-containing protein [Caballeronia choica]SAL26872.1 sugar ABC transporter substrate-binding protein [Caballeronia choica]
MLFKLGVSQAAVQKLQSPFVAQETTPAHQRSLKNRRDLRYWPGKILVSATQLSASLLLSTGLLCTAAYAAEDSITNHQGDITPMCGTKPMIVGISDGYGGNTWRKTGLEEARDELSRCKNVKRIIYSNANGDAQKANSDINSMVAQGVNVLILLPDFGAVQLPAMRAAMKAGVAVVPYSAQMAGVPGRDYVVNVVGDTNQIGVLWADWLGTTLKKGNVVFMGGSPGATTSQNFMDGLRGGLKKYPGLKLLNEQYIVTNWNPVDAQKATAGLIAQYPKIDAIVTDGGGTAQAAIKAFEQAHLPVPAIATIASNNELNCHFLAAKQSGKPFPYYTLDGTTTYVRFAVRQGVAAYQGTVNKESPVILPFPYADSAKGLDPKCDAAAPPDADLTSALPPQKLKAVFEH